MMKNTKNIAFAFIMTLFFAIGGSSVFAAGPGLTTSGAPKKVESITTTKAVKKTNTLEYIKAGDAFTMEMNSWMRGDLEIQISDIDGNVVQTTKTRVNGQDNTLKFKADDLHKGFYKIKVLTKSRVQKKNIVID